MPSLRDLNRINTEIADAIRGKSGTSGTMKLSEMPGLVEGIQTGGSTAQWMKYTYLGPTTSSTSQGAVGRTISITFPKPLDADKSMMVCVMLYQGFSGNDNDYVGNVGFIYFKNKQYHGAFDNFGNSEGIRFIKSGYPYTNIEAGGYFYIGDGTNIAVNATGITMPVTIRPKRILYSGSPNGTLGVYPPIIYVVAADYGS